MRAGQEHGRRKRNVRVKMWQSSEIFDHVLAFGRRNRLPHLTSPPLMKCKHRIHFLTKMYKLQTSAIKPTFAWGGPSSRPRDTVENHPVTWGYLDRQWIGYQPTSVGRRPLRQAGSL